MISPGQYDIRADRWVACLRQFNFVGVDFTGATFAAELRLTPNATGAALVTLANASAGAEGLRLIAATTATVAAHIAAGRLAEVPPGYTLASVVVVSEVGMRINETTMEGLPFGPERDSDSPLAWDLLVTPSGGIKDKYLGGDFIVLAGVTQ